MHRSTTKTNRGINLRQRRRQATAAAMLICVFIIAVMSMMVIRILDVEAAQLAALRNTSNYERALYLAGASVHHALAELEADFGWRGTVTEGNYPADDTYSATAVDGTGNEVVVTGIGVAGDVTRKLQVTVIDGG